MKKELIEFNNIYNKLMKYYDNISILKMNDNLCIAIWDNKILLNIIDYDVNNSTFNYFGNNNTYNKIIKICDDIKIKNINIGKYIYLKNNELDKIVKNNISSLTGEDLNRFIEMKETGKSFLKISYENKKDFVVKNNIDYIYISKKQCWVYEKRKYNEIIL